MLSSSTILNFMNLERHGLTCKLTEGMLLPPGKNVGMNQMLYLISRINRTPNPIREPHVLICSKSSVYLGRSQYQEGRKINISQSPGARTKVFQILVKFHFFI